MNKKIKLGGTDLSTVLQVNDLSRMIVENALKNNFETVLVSTLRGPLKPGDVITSSDNKKQIVTLVLSDTCVVTKKFNWFIYFWYRLINFLSHFKINKRGVML